MVKKWLHINDIGGDPWVLPIWAAIHDAIKTGTINKTLEECQEQLSELTLYVSIRLNMLPLILARINKRSKKIFSLSNNHDYENECTKIKEGNVIELERKIVYKILLDIDALLFELNTLCELWVTLIEKLYLLVGKPIPKESIKSEIRKMLHASNVDAKWFSNLDSLRNFFIHEGTPWIAIDITKGNGKYDLIIMKKNCKTFNNRKQYILLSEVNDIVRGFSKTRHALQIHLISLFSSLP